GGSATGDGVSLAQHGIPLAVPAGNRNVWLAIGPDGRQVVAYVDGDTILVRRWNGATWDLILGPGLASGNVPQLAIDANGRTYLAWRQFSGATSTWEVFLLALDPAGTTWQPLGTSGSGGGITGAEGAAGVPAFSLALAADGTPYIAYQTTVLANTDFTTHASGLSQGTQQVYVRRWTGTAWAFVGSGREGGGASNALTFHFTNADGSGNFAVHGAEYPILAIGADGNPLVVFIYTNAFTSGNPPEFNGENDDLYAVRWTGTAWAPLGPALPTVAAGAGLGAPGGITNTPGWIREVSHDRLVRHSLAIDHDGAPILAWGETTQSDGFRRIYVFRWDGTTWQGMGSASGEIDMIAYSYDTSLAIGRDGPILTWPRGGGVQSWVNVLAWSPSEGRWHELGAGSASGQGVSAPNDAGFNPRIAINAAGVPSVAWIDATPPVPQAYLRAYLEQSLPDLTVSSVSAPATVPAGQSFTVSAVVHNAGTAAAPASTVTLYLGTGTTRSPGDVALGSVASPDLAIAARATVSTTVTMPAGTASGPYHVVAVVDEANSVTELSDANNTGASGAVTVPSPPAPDLDVTALSTPASAAAGGSLSVQHTVANVGTAATGSFSVRFYLSTDDVLDAGDVLLGTRAFTGLAAGASSAGTTALTLPASTTAPATYHVIAMAALDQGTDADPSNNGAVSPAIDVTSRVLPNMPDLTAGDVVLPATAQAGRPLAIRHTVRNVGPVAAGAFTVRFYLSTDEAFDAGDALLGSRMLGGLAAGASSTAVSTFTLPAGTTVPDTYRVLVVADALGQVSEQDKTNNVGVSGPLPVTAYRPDLTITDVSVPATAAVGRPFTIRQTTRNVGPAPSSGFLVRYYLSTDDTLDAGDVALGTRGFGGLGAGAARTDTATLVLPGNVSAPAKYRIIAVAA
ncbi:MAG TPA: CARDB domain-containing protein, partial [Methylomirabilota bacterium]|nr:CARDB domain-containing protein [Methylomirabilota bacterium]